LPHFYGTGFPAIKQLKAYILEQEAKKTYPLHRSEKKDEAI